MIGVDLMVGWEFDAVIFLPLLLIGVVCAVVWANTREPE